MEITQPLHRAAQLTPDRPLTIFGDRTRTVAEVADRVARFAGALRKLGVREGDRVGIMSLNSDVFHEVLLAVPWAGAVVVPVNYRWSPSEIAFSLAECEVVVLVVDDTFLDVAYSVQQSDGVSARLIHTGEKPADGALDYESLLRDSDPVEDAGRGGSDQFGIFYTGGTTGTPKGVVLSHDNMMVSGLGCVASGEYVTPDGRLLHVAPMFHLADLSTWTGAMIVGATHVFVPSFSPAGTLRVIEEQCVTDVLLVPTMIQMLVDAPEARQYDVSSLSHVIYGASPMPEGVQRRARELFRNSTFLQAYGMTELGPVATLLLMKDHDDPVRRRSAGRAAPHTQVKVVDPLGSEVPRGTVGEIIVRSGAAMLGYWNRPTETAKVLRDGWMHTGDGGYMDESGYVFVVDRIKDMIITGGENVYSVEVENVLSQHPAVAACAVIGLPDERWGERVHAVVVLQPGATTSLEELMELCRSQIAGYKVPRSVSFVDKLPVSAAGKILKRELRTQG